MRKPLLNFDVLRAILCLGGRQCGKSHLRTEQFELAIGPGLKEHAATVFFLGLKIGIDAATRRRCRMCVVIAREQERAEISLVGDIHETAVTFGEI